MVVRTVFPESQETGQSVPIPSPSGGLNTRDAFSKVQPSEARELTNFFPDFGAVVVRPGYLAHANTAISTESLIVFAGKTGSQLLAAGGGKLFDVTSGSPVAVANTSYIDNKWCTENFHGNGSAPSFLIGVNGSDAPWHWNGTTLQTTTFTAPDNEPSLNVNTLRTVSLVRNRLWFTVNNSADVYYSGEASVQGALTKFPVSQFATGGKCVDVGGWSTAGEGPTDSTVFIFDTGEVILYNGNPENTLGEVGKFRIPRPITSSFGCTVKVAGQLVVLTVAGPIPMSFIVQGVAFDPNSIGAWGKINPSWAKDYATYGHNDGWSALFHNGVAYFNIITSTNKTKQYVFNTAVQAWTIYTDLPAGQWVGMDDEIYFNEYNNSHIYLHKSGTDNGKRIVATARQGFTYPISTGVSKHFTMIRPAFIADGPCQAQLQIDVDFNTAAFNGTLHTVVTSTGGSPWDSPWDAPWGTAPEAKRAWRAVTGYGVAMSPAVRVFSTAANFRWEACEVMAVEGGIF